ncbi:MAG: NAD-dependent epimerase/dehydratase family protein [Anaerolineae bacterium]|nr:NAD-dependent epimerase/dehydratase family protein [Anaerolineae bacterium]
MGSSQNALFFNITENLSPRLPVPVLITGATGFIGRWLLKYLLAAGVPVAALVHLGDETPQFDGVDCFKCDIADAAAVQSVFDQVRPALIFHLAAVGLADPNLSFDLALRVNVAGTLNILHAANTLDHIQRCVLVGSSYEYGARQSDSGLDPFSAYSASKVAAWAFARAAHNAWNLPVVWMRPFQVYGPGQHPRAFIPAAITAALQGADFRMTPGQQKRDFIYVEDVVTGLLFAAVAPDDVNGRELDLGTGDLHTLYDVVSLIWQLTSATGDILAGALSYRPGEVPAIPSNVGRTRRLTGWQSRVDLATGLERTISSQEKAQSL